MGEEMYYKIREIIDSLDINIKDGIITTKKGGHGTIDGTGYLVFKLNRTKFQLHQVLAVIHFGKDCIGMTVNHINGIKTDNSIDNLELMTLSDNAKHEHSIGLAKYVKKENQRKKVKQFDVDGNCVSEFESMSEASKATGISTGNISRSCRKNIKTNGYLWQLA
jgi:hypothetical protein